MVECRLYSPWVDIPRPVSHLMQTQLLRNLSWRHGWTRISCVSLPDDTRTTSTSSPVHSPPDRSCLFANTINRQSFISLSARILSNSSRASSILSLSPESITKIRPWLSARDPKCTIPTYLGTGVIMSPKRPDLVLTSNILQRVSNHHPLRSDSRTMTWQYPFIGCA
jgi:hypothetical protein